jgi:uncharacterized protein (DUF4415 family)
MRSQTDSVRLKTEASEPGKGTSDHPESDVHHIVDEIVRRGLQLLPAKTLISVRIDRDVLEWFKAQGPGYQTRINAVLRAFRDASV